MTDIYPDEDIDLTPTDRRINLKELSRRHNERVDEFMAETFAEAAQETFERIISFIPILNKKSKLNAASHKPKI